MRKVTHCTTIIGLVFGLGVIGSTVAEPGGAGQFDGLAGRIFAVKAEVVYSIDPNVPVGLVFENCYYFNADGSWFDPLYPDLGIAVPGIWIQHTDQPRIDFTATVADPSLVPGLLLIQNGTVKPGSPGASERRQRLLAYTTVIVDGTLLAIEVVSRGRAVPECPFF